MATSRRSASGSSLVAILLLIVIVVTIGLVAHYVWQSHTAVTKKPTTSLVPHKITDNVSPQQSVPTTSPADQQWPTMYLSGKYPQGWSYQLLPNDFFDYSVCSGNVEWNRFTQAGVNDVHVDICSTQQTSPETILETIAPNTDTATARKYTPHTAVSSTRFGLHGLKGTWQQGADGGYAPQYFEVYLKNNLMMLILPTMGDNQAYENLLSNITLKF